MNDTYIKNIRLIKSIDSNLFFKLRETYDDSYTIIKDSDTGYSILKNSQKVFSFSITSTAMKNYPAYVFTSLLAFCNHILGNASFSLKNSLYIVNLENLSMVNILLLVFPLFYWINGSNTLFVYDEASMHAAISRLAEIKDLFDQPPALLTIPHYEQLQPSSYLVCLNNLKLSISLLLSDFITTKVMLYRQIKNILLNSSFFTKILRLPEYPIYETVCIVGAGQSLDNHIPDLKQCYEKNIPIIAVDTAYRFLMKNGIIPSFVIILDSQSLNLQDFIFCPIYEKTLFIVEISSYYRIVRHLTKHHAHYCFFSAHLEAKENNAPPHEFALIIEKAFNIPSMLIHGNVGIAGLIFGTIIGRHVVSYGYDASFGSLIYHCKETLDQRYFLLSSSFNKPMLSFATIHSLQHSFNHRTSLPLLQNKTKLELYKIETINKNFQATKKNKSIAMNRFTKTQNIKRTEIINSIIEKGCIEKAFSLIYKKIPKQVKNLILMAKKL